MFDLDNDICGRFVWMIVHLFLYKAHISNIQHLETAWWHAMIADVFDGWVYDSGAGVREICERVHLLLLVASLLAYLLLNFLLPL